MDLVGIRLKNETLSSRPAACQLRFVGTRWKDQTPSAPPEVCFVVFVAHFCGLEAVNGLGKGCEVIETIEGVIRQAIGTSDKDAEVPSPAFKMFKGAD